MHEIGRTHAVAAAAIFFDRDNTLIVNDGYLGDPARVVLMPNAAAAVAQARQMGFAVVTVSNQSGVARGMFGEDAVAAVNRRIDQLLLADDADARIDLHLYCPYHPQALVPKYRQESDSRKPAPGMLLAAAERLNLDLRRSWIIGDSPRDIEAGIRAGCKSILFLPPGVPPSPAASERSVIPDHQVCDLGEAMLIIQKSLG